MANSKKAEKEQLDKQRKDELTLLSLGYSIYEQLSSPSERVSRDIFFMKYRANKTCFQRLIEAEENMTDNPYAQDIPEITEEKAEELLRINEPQAVEVLDYPDKLERLLQRADQKLKTVTRFGKKLAEVSTYIDLLRDFSAGDYTAMSRRGLITVICALIYFVSPLDVIPDTLPILGYFDDVSVFDACWKQVRAEMEAYKAWREKRAAQSVSNDAENRI